MRKFIWLMSKYANTDYSLAHPEILDELSRKRVAPQIMAVLKQTIPEFDFGKSVVLDLGSSNGINDKYLAGNFQHIYGIDVDKNAIKIAQKKYTNKKLSFAVFDGEKIPFSDRKFDIIIFRRAFEYAKKPESLIPEIERVLKMEGIVYFEVNNRLFPANIFPLFIKKLIYNFFGKKIYYFSHDPHYWQLKKLFKKFNIYQVTPLIIKNPENYYFYQRFFGLKIGKNIPLWILKLIEPFFPSFIWILKLKQS